MNVTPGETLYVEVGGAGQSQEDGGEGGFNGGGNGGGGGGGASDIRLESRSTPLSTEDTRLIVAAGGGGAGSLGETAGTAGGNAGEPGEDGEYPGGEPGTETEGGAGSFGCEPAGQGGNGELGQGGSGGNSEFLTGPGGGGGGGLYGGGGGGGACIVGSSGGGGGFSLLPGGGLVVLTTAPPQVEIVYAKPPTIAISSPTAGATVTQGQALTASYECSSPDVPAIPIAECAGSVPDGAALDTSTLGPHTLTVEAEDLAENTASASVSYTVVAAPPPPPGPSSSTAALPETTITAHPKKTVKTKKKKAKVKFSFSSDAAGATFQCKLDKGSFAPCTSPKSYKAKKGKHTFSVEAVGPAGTDLSPATFSFKVKKKT